MLRDVLSHALRQTWRSRRVSIVIVATVAIAGAAGSVLLAAAGSFLSVRIPGVDTDALAEAFHTHRGVRYAWSLPLVEEFAASAHHAVYAGGSVILKTIDTPSGPAWMKIETVTTNYSDVIGVRPIAGRWFTADENSVPMRDHVALLSESVCRRAFGGPDRCLGSRIDMGAATLTVIGVMPAPFRGTHGDTDAWVPLMLAPLGIGRAGQPFPFWTTPSAHWMQLIARVARPEDLPAAREEFLGIYDRFARGQHWIADSTPQTDRAMPELLTIRDSRLDPIIVRAARSVDAAVFVLVLMTCANATLLFIAQLHGRTRQIAIQLALGATRARTLAGLLAETTIIGGVAVITGTAAAIGASRALARLTQHMPEVRVAGLDLAPAVWRSGIGSGSAIIGLLAIPLLAIGMLIGWHTLGDGLSSGAALSRRPPSGLRVRGWQGWVLAFEIGNAVILAIGGGLLAASYGQAISTYPGFAVDRVLTVRLPPSSAANGPSDSIPGAVRQTGGVREVGRIECLPLSRACLGAAVGRGDDLTISAVLNRVDASTFAILQIRASEGRVFTASEASAAEKLAVVSRSVRARLGPDARRVDIAGFGSARVVGVVEDVKYDGLTETAKPAVYVPWQQSPPALPGALVIETDGPSASFVASVREQLARQRADFAVADVRPLADVFGESALEQRLQMILLVAFAVVASVVCAAGVIGVTSFTVNAGLPEIGIRLALGASPAGAVALVMSKVGRFIAAGVIGGLAASVVARSWWTPLLYRVDPLDRSVFGLGAGSILVIACGSVLWIARRAARVDPALTLRAE